MPRYYFDLINDVPHSDRQGIDFPNDWTAERHAAEKMRTIVKRPGAAAHRVHLVDVQFADFVVQLSHVQVSCSSERGHSRRP